MAPSFANMPPRARAAFITAQLDRYRELAAAAQSATAATSNEKPNLGQEAKSQPQTDSQRSPKQKRVRATLVTHAKASLRAKSRVKSKIDIAPESDFDRHRRKCQVCNHPEREAIEELFINWHSPRSIRSELGIQSRLDWSAIYRHARAAGLYAKRRQNLRAVLDLILEQASDVAPTAHGIVAVVRAYSCLTDTHQWVEPEKRVRITNHVYRHDVPAASTTSIMEEGSFVQGSASAGAPSFAPSAKGGSSSASRACHHTSTTSAQSSAEPVSVTAAECPQKRSNASLSASPVSSAEPLVSNLATSHSSLATGFSNRHTSELESPPTHT